VQAPTFIGIGITYRQLCADGVQFCLRLLDTDARLQEGEHTEVVILTSGEFLLRGNEGSPKLKIRGEVESWLLGRDTDDGLRLAVEEDGLSDGGRVAAESFAP